MDSITPQEFRLLQKDTRFRSVSCRLADFVRVSRVYFRRKERLVTLLTPESSRAVGEPAEQDLFRSKDQLHSLRSLR